MPDLDPVHESYKNAGLFLGLLQSKLGFGWLSMAFNERLVHFQWQCVVRKEKRTIERSMSLISLHLSRVPLEVMASDMARSMKDAMLHSQVKEHDRLTPIHEQAAILDKMRLSQYEASKEVQNVPV